MPDWQTIVVTDALRAAWAALEEVFRTEGHITPTERLGLVVVTEGGDATELRAQLDAANARVAELEADLAAMAPFVVYAGQARTSLDAIDAVPRPEPLIVP